MIRKPTAVEVLLLLPLVTASACATKEPPPPQAKGEDNVFVGDEPVFATLTQQGDGEWTFGKVTRSNDEPENGFLVRLNDLAPAFDTRPAECEPRPYREADRCNPLNPFRRKDLGVMSKIVDSGISAGTGGAIKGVTRSYETTFDRLEFNAAVDKALLSTGLDEHRVDFIDKLMRLEEMTAAHDAALEDLGRRIVSEYEQDKANLRYDLTVTGLDEYYSHDLDPAEVVTVSAQAPTWANLVDTGDANEVLPCDAAHCMERVRDAVRRAATQQEARMSSLRAKLDAQTNSYDVDCSATEHGGYHFEMSCPQQLKRTPGAMELPVRIHIRSRDFDHLFPPFSNGDDRLAARIEHGQLVLENLTSDFIEVESVSIYYNSQVNTVSDDSGQLDLAPRQKVSKQVSLFSSPAIDVESKHANMTPDKARRSRFTFGLAVKYSLGNRNEIETVYAVHDYEVQCAIEARLRPGACTPAVDRDGTMAADE